MSSRRIKTSHSGDDDPPTAEWDEPHSQRARSSGPRNGFLAIFLAILDKEEAGHLALLFSESPFIRPAQQILAIFLAILDKEEAGHLAPLFSESPFIRPAQTDPRNFVAIVGVGRAPSLTALHRNEPFQSNRMTSSSKSPCDPGQSWDDGRTSIRELPSDKVARLIGSVWTRSSWLGVDTIIDRSPSIAGPSRPACLVLDMANAHEGNSKQGFVDVTVVRPPRLPRKGR